MIRCIEILFLTGVVYELARIRSIKITSSSFLAVFAVSDSCVHYLDNIAVSLAVSFLYRNSSNYFFDLGSEINFSIVSQFYAVLRYLEQIPV